jgi:hypothetical protein
VVAPATTCSSSDEPSPPADLSHGQNGQIVFVSSGQDDTQTFFISIADGSGKRKLTAPGSLW